MIIPRYLTREIVLTLLAVTGVLLLTFISNQFALYLNKAAGGRFAINLLLRLTVIEIPHMLSMLLPLGLFIGILLGYGRLYADNEMTVMTVGGLSRAKLVLFTLPIITVIVIIVAILCFWLNPHLITYRNSLLAQAGSALELQTTIPGQFRQVEGGRRIFYVEKISTDKQKMQKVFVAQLLKDPGTAPILPWVISTAESGYQTINLNNGDRFFVTVNGHLYKGVPGQNDFQIMNFDKFGIRIESHMNALKNKIDAAPTMTLWYDNKNRITALAELHWRFALPFATLLLALLAIPLSKIENRRYRYAQLLPAMLICVVYINLLVVGYNWLQRNLISPALGLWWAHGLLILAILVVWIREIGWLRIKQLWQQYL